MLVAIQVWETTLVSVTLTSLLVHMKVGFAMVNLRVRAAKLDDADSEAQQWLFALSSVKHGHRDRILIVQVGMNNAPQWIRSISTSWYLPST